ncbi:LacI family transcriptional regulator [Branchiibius hedensis]|uniref:DNA-binding transcriptional regulator, LacI/PurR family n=1 Tax=Branchiibius hedensis TaxID=672460 RepID=A0A2Y9C2I3_9MICO|nr:LacI family DNA-binding transcriptional regulator [Branchiibius hedensis]PWJ27322.1 LacI family transcriptional regulator [Branchiibius hedensis]SSA36133.1 DNA-binding transcriptional regulator, LacI/PurR family [Branchiibius hedensis]
MTSRRVTIRDVASAAGVSATTVSHVLSGNGRVHPETRARVNDTVEQLGYRPNPVAANLRRSTFGSVGLVLPPSSLNYAFYSELMIGASEVLLEEATALSLIPPSAAPGQLSELAVDAVIIAEPRTNDPVLQELSQSGKPTVLCEGSPDELPPDMWTVDSDTTASVGATLDHLHASGARRIAAVVVEPVLWWGRNVLTAIDTWEAATGRTVRRGIIPFAVTPTQARDQIRALLKDGWPDALLVCHEGLGASALATAHRLGRQVPDDLLVACTVDGPDLLTLETPVTALDLRPRRIGQAAARLVLERPSLPGTTIHPELHLRASTARQRPTGSAG